MSDTDTDREISPNRMGRSSPFLDPAPKTDQGADQTPDPTAGATNLGGQLASYGGGRPSTSVPPELPMPMQAEPYINSGMPADHASWGRPDFILQGARNYPGVMPGPWMPQAGDVNRLIAQTGQWYNQNGDPTTAALGAQMVNYRGRYMKEFMAGREAAMKMAHEQYVFAQEQIVQRETEQLRKASDIFAAYGADASGRGGDQDKIREELGVLFAGDPHMTAALATGDTARAYSLLQDRNMRNDAMMKVVEQREKMANSKGQQLRDDADAFLGTGGRDQPAAPGGSVIPSVGAQPGTPTSAPTGGDAASTLGTEPDASALPPIEDPKAGATPPAPAGSPPAAAGTAPAAPDQAQAAAAAPTQTAAATPDQTGARPAPVTAGTGYLPSFLPVPGKRIDPNDPQSPVETFGSKILGPFAWQDKPQTTEPPQPKLSDIVGKPGEKTPAPQKPETKAITLPDPNARDLSDSPALANVRHLYPGITDDGVRRVDQAAQNVMLGGKLAEYPKLLQPVIKARSDELIGKLSRVKGTGQEAMNEVAAISPMMGELLKGYIDGTKAPPKGYAATRPPLNMLFPLAKKIDPSMDENRFAMRGAIRKSFATGADAKNLTSNGTMYMHAREAQRLLAELSANRDVLGQYMATHRFEGWMNPQLRDLVVRADLVLTTLNTEYQRATHGQVTRYGTLESHPMFDWRNLGVDAVMQNVAEAEQLANDRIFQSKRRWDTFGGQSSMDMQGLFTQFATGGGQDDAGTVATPEVVQAVNDVLAGNRPGGIAPVPKYDWWFYNAPNEASRKLPTFDPRTGKPTE